MPTEAWQTRVGEVVQRAHDENWGGAHRSDVFCKACSDAYIVAQYAVPDDYEAPAESRERQDG